MPSLFGKHAIGYRDPGGTVAKSPVAIPAAAFGFPQGPSYVYEKRFGTDKWVLRVQWVLEQLLSDATRRGDPSNSGMKIEISCLQVTDFLKGLLQWSNHKVTTTFRYALLDSDGRCLKEGAVSGQGEGSGKEFGVMTYVPLLGNLNHDKGIELALSRSLCDCLTSLAQDLREIRKAE